MPNLSTAPSWRQCVHLATRCLCTIALATAEASNALSETDRCVVRAVLHLDTSGPELLGGRYWRPPGRLRLESLHGPYASPIFC
eukprot:SAG31_NODE_30163_length_384_cov_2.161404_1_plen_83_part_10